MNKLITRTVITLLILSLLILTLSGCDSPDSDKEQPSVAVAIVLGNHSSAFSLNMSSPDLISTVSKATANGFVSVICADGKPHVASADIYVVPEQYRQADPKKLEADARQKATKILSSLVYVKAQNPELDTLTALSQAVRSLSSTPADSEKMIYVLDTGLSTTGVLDFRENLLDADPDAIADLLAERDALPDFSGITVKWQQLGDVSPPQQSLSHAQVKILGAIWTAIIEKGGGTMEISDIPPGQTVNDSTGFPKISVVNLPPEKSITFETSEIVVEEEKPIVFTEKQVRFIGDTAKYVDAKKTEEVLKPVAEYMIANPDFKGLLVGTTATGGKDSCLKLSEDRAKAVRDTLVSMGVPDKRLITLGLGFDDPWHVPDTDSGGNLIEKLASQNRKVVLMAADSEAAKSLLDKS